MKPLPLKLDPHDPLPLYAQLELALRLAIATGKLRAGDQLPTVRQLAVDLRVNANTVSKVYVELERQGVLTTRRGVGTFVVTSAPANRPAGADGAAKLIRLAEHYLAEAVSQGFSPDEALEQVQRLCSNSKEKSNARR